MRILYIDQYFSTRDGNSGTRSFEFARLFVKAGHEVTLLTTASGYSNLAGQRNRIERKTIDGIRVVSFRIGYDQKMRASRRMLSFVLFMLASAAYGLLLPRHDVVFASSTPLSVGVAGVLVSRLKGVPLVFEVRDLWPRAPIELGVIRRPEVIRFLYAAERWIYRNSSRINALSPGMREGILSTGIAPEKVACVPNACDFDLAPVGIDRSAERKKIGVPEKAFLVVYAGTLGPSNGLTALFKVAHRVRAKGGKNIRFCIVGTGSESATLRKEAAGLGLDNLLFAGGLSRTETAKILASADLGVTCFAPVPVLRTNSPNKLFDYLALGLPQMVNAPGWMQEIVEDGDAGFFWPHDKPEEAAEKILRLAKAPKQLAAMRAGARKTAERFERGLLAGRLLDLFATARGDVENGLPIYLYDAVNRIAALAVLLVLSPILVPLALFVRFEDGGPVFYRPTRIGAGERPFGMFKFRTMVVNADKIGAGLNVDQNDARITRIGKFLRNWSLDELPQIINILAGDMRFVGPRPALAEHAKRFDEKQRVRFRVKPGLTGWAQVNGRNDLTWAQKLTFDAWYAENRSLGLDLRIILRTFGVVARREGLYERDGGASDPFNRFDD